MAEAPEFFPRARAHAEPTRDASYGNSSANRRTADLVIQCQSREQAETALAHVHTCDNGSLNVALRCIRPRRKSSMWTTDGFELLGYRFIKRRRFPRQKSLAKFRETIRGKARRNNGSSRQPRCRSASNTQSLHQRAESLRRRWRFIATQRQPAPLAWRTAALASKRRWSPTHLHLIAWLG